MAQPAQLQVTAGLWCLTRDGMGAAWPYEAPGAAVFIRGSTRTTNRATSGAMLAQAGAPSPSP
jgi:hypothetical protein